VDFVTRDLRLAARGLLRSRAFLLMATGAVALGIGANATVFSVVNSLMVRPLPFERADRLLYLDERSPERGSGDWMSTSWLDLQDWRAQSRTVREMAGFYDAAFDLSGGDEAERASGAMVTDNLFRTLRARPLLGRTFTADEGRPGAPAVVVLGHGLWTRRFAADPAVLGRTLLIDGTGHTIVGVMPPRFRFPEYAELWVPVRVGASAARRDVRNLAVVGRLAPGVELGQAAQEMATINWRLTEQFPRTNDGVTVAVKPLHAALRGETTQAAVLFQGITLLVLLVAWANVGNLLLVRAVGRRREIAIRGALGATRGHVLRQLAAEGLVLAAVGGTLGLGLGLLGRRLLVAAIPIELPFWVSFDFDWRVLAFVAAVSLAGVLFFALAPALQVGRIDLQGALQAGGGRGTAGRGGGRMQSALVVAETALALVLLISAGLMSRSLGRLQAVDPGFSARGVATVRLSLPSRRYPAPGQQQAVWSRLLEGARAIPGVEAAAVVSALPLSGGSKAREVALEGRAPQKEDEGTFALGNTVGGDYFRLMGIAVREGRAFDGRDRAGAGPTAVVSEAMARRFWPGGGALGRRVRFAGPGEPWRTVVGVVGDVKDSRLANPTWPTLYVPAAQSSLAFAHLAVRTRSGAAAALGPLRAAVHGVDPDVPVDQAWTMAEVVRRSAWLSRLYAWLAGVFAAIALALSAVGTYGLLGYLVRQRTQEIGIRAALGARPRDVVGLFVGRGMRLAGLAVLIGLPAGLGLARLLSALLFGMGAWDAPVFAAVPVLVLAVALVASFAPAHAATRVAPSTALRHD
jgi:putative ABC transport system permease protein